jgi:hypothetical protein
MRRRRLFELRGCGCWCKRSGKRGGVGLLACEVVGSVVHGILHSGGVVSFGVGRLASSTALSGYLHHAQEGLYLGGWKWVGQHCSGE